MQIERKNGGKFMMCTMCGNELFAMDHRSSCDGCEYNGVRDDITCVYHYPFGDHDNRNQAKQEWECAQGSNYNAGCDLLTCKRCGYVDFIPFAQEVNS